MSFQGSHGFRLVIVSVRLPRRVGEARIACLTKMTSQFLGPGFLVALLISKYRRDLLTPWTWLGTAVYLVVVSPYLLWQCLLGKSA